MMPAVFGRGFGRGMNRTMGYGMGRGMGRGRGFAFRGSSPPWPYIGRGRGGLPRCGYFAGGGQWMAGYLNPYPANAGTYQPAWDQQYDPAFSASQGLSALKEQAEMIRREIESINSRISALEND